jgi:hypothetical protein
MENFGFLAQVGFLTSISCVLVGLGLLIFSKKISKNILRFASVLSIIAVAIASIVSFSVAVSFGQAPFFTYQLAVNLGYLPPLADPLAYYITCSSTTLAVIALCLSVYVCLFLNKYYDASIKRLLSFLLISLMLTGASWCLLLFN